MPYNESLASRIEKFFTAKRVAFESKRMMGGLVFMVNGKMCVGVEQTRLMARIDPDGQTAALARNGCSPMDFTGRPLRGFVFVTTEVLQTDAQLESSPFPDLKEDGEIGQARSRCARPEEGWGRGFTPEPAAIPGGWDPKDRGVKPLPRDRR